MCTDIFRFVDYKEYLKFKIAQNRSRIGYQSRMSEAMKCNKSFLSQVIHGKTHITPDHAVTLAHFWGLNQEQTHYFLDLVLLGRSDTPNLKSVLTQRILDSRRDNLAEPEFAEREGAPGL